MKKLLNIIIILILSNAAYAQVYKAYLNAADKAYESNDFRTAVSYYGEAVELEKEPAAELLIKYADSARKYKAYNTAESAYTLILEREEQEYKIESLFQLAQIKLVKGEYELSKTVFGKYLRENDTDELRKAKAAKSIEDLEWAMSLDKNENTLVERLDNQVNTEYSEMSPFFMNDKLYFSSNNYYASNEDIKPFSKIYTYENGKSNLLKNAINNGDEHTGHYTLNSDASKIYFTRCNYNLAEVKCKIYVQDTDDKGSVRELPRNINAQGSHNSQPSIGVDPNTGNEVLYFSSDRTGGAGGSDLYYSPIKNGVLQGPFPLSDLNTPGDEVSPFYHSATHKLYFSTDGRKTLGGYDIYSAYNGEQWTDIRNLGTGVNSSYNDAYYFLNVDGTKAYFSSNRIGSEFIDDELEACCYDIYSAELEVIAQDVLVKLFDAETKKPLPGVELLVKTLPSINEEVFLEPNASEYAIKLSNNLNFELLAEKQGYEVSSQELIGANLDAEKEIYLTPAALALSAIVINEESQELGDFTYTLTREGMDESTKNEVGDEKIIKDKITKHKDYTLTVEKEGYYPETIILKKEDLQKEAKLDINIKLKKISAAVLAKLNLDGYLPMPLYFDNDEPDNRTTSKTTAQNYHGTFMKYFARLPEYINKNVEGLNNEVRLDVESQINSFFQTEVKFGDDALEGFTNHLYNFLLQGSQAEIMLRGYASPRSRSDYNDALTSRRVRSVENHFYQWKGGLLVPFIESGQLKLTERPLGESAAPAGISDDILDVRASIYSIEASRERRVEILEIKSSNVSPY